MCYFRFPFANISVLIILCYFCEPFFAGEEHVRRHPEIVAAAARAEAEDRREEAEERRRKAVAERAAASPTGESGELSSACVGRKRICFPFVTIRCIMWNRIR